MKLTSIVFSPTGGTRKVADAIASKWQEPEVLDISVKDADYSSIAFSSEDAVIISLPSFGGLAPQVALDRICAMTGGGAKCVLVAVYGNREYEDTLVQMEDVATAAGFTVIAAIAAVAEHSVIRKFAAGRPDHADRIILAEFGEKIAAKLSAGDFSLPAIPGNRPYKKPGKGSLVPKADANCISCGVCAAKCPVGAIESLTPMETGDSCIGCMRCISVCPNGARAVDSDIVSVVALKLEKVCSEKKYNELFI